MRPSRGGVALQSHDERNAQKPCAIVFVLRGGALDVAGHRHGNRKWTPSRTCEPAEIGAPRDRLGHSNLRRSSLPGSPRLGLEPFAQLGRNRATSPRTI